MISSCDLSHVLPGTFMVVLSYTWVLIAVYGVIVTGTFFGIRKNINGLTGIVFDFLVALFWPVSLIAFVVSLFSSKSDKNVRFF